MRPNVDDRRTRDVAGKCREKQTSQRDSKRMRPNIEIGGEGLFTILSLVAIYLPPTVRPPGSSLGPSGTNVDVAASGVSCLVFVWF